MAGLPEPGVLSTRLIHSWPGTIFRLFDCLALRIRTFVDPAIYVEFKICPIPGPSAEVNGYSFLSPTGMEAISIITVLTGLAMS